MTKKMTRINSPEYRPLSPLTVGLSGEGRSSTCLDTIKEVEKMSFEEPVQFRCPAAVQVLLSHSKLSSLHTHPSGGEKGKCFKATHSALH